MNEERGVAHLDLSDLHDRLVADFELVDSMVGMPALNATINKALAGIQYQVARAAQMTKALLEDAQAWESN